MMSKQYVGGLGLAKSRSVLRMETAYGEADLSDQGFVAWDTRRTRMISSSKARSLCPLTPYKQFPP